MGDELSAGLVTGDEVGHDELNDSVRVRVLLVLEIETVMDLSNGDGFFVGVVSHDHLFQIEESTLMVDALSELDLRLPSMGRVGLLTVRALQVRNDELNLESLLKQGVSLDFLLDRQLYLYSTRMRFSPDKGRVEKLHSFHTFDVFEAKGEELGAFQLSERPGRSKIPIAIAAMLECE